MTSTDAKIEGKNINQIIEEFIKKGMVNTDWMNRKTPWNTDEYSLFDQSGDRITFLEDL